MKILTKRNLQRNELYFETLYAYNNSTNELQVIRSGNTTVWYFERVVFSGERLLFEAPLNFELEVYTSYLGQPLLAQRIPGYKLKVSRLTFNQLPGLRRGL